MPEKHTLIGWSDVCNSAEILETIRKNKQTILIRAMIVAVIVSIGFLLAGLFYAEIPLSQALAIGIGLGLMVLIIGLWRIGAMRKPPWEGVVIKKMEKKRYKTGGDDGSNLSYTKYTLLVLSNAGQKKRIVGRNGNLAMYGYLEVGDRVRYHPALQTYEKYNKSKDKVIYCNVCQLKNSITHDRCSRCHSLLFK